MAYGYVTPYLRPQKRSDEEKSGAKGDLDRRDRRLLQDAAIRVEENA